MNLFATKSLSRILAEAEGRALAEADAGPDSAGRAGHRRDHRRGPVLVDRNRCGE